MKESGGPTVGSQDGLQAQGTVSTTSAPVVRQKPRVRARRGQATDPHSIAERVCLPLFTSSISFSYLVFLIVWFWTAKKGTHRRAYEVSPRIGSQHQQGTHCFLNILQLLSESE